MMECVIKVYYEIGGQFLRPEPRLQPQEQHGRAERADGTATGRQNSGEAKNLIFQEQLYSQIYLYTFTGLHDKAGNHLTQFMGLLLK